MGTIRLGKHMLTKKEHLSYKVEGAEHIIEYVDSVVSNTPVSGETPGLNTGTFVVGVSVVDSHLEIAYSDGHKESIPFN